MFFPNGYAACKGLHLAKGHSTILYIHKAYTLDSLVTDLTHRVGLERIKVRNDAGGMTIIEAENHDKFGKDLSELGSFRVFLKQEEAERSWLFMLNALNKQFKKILKQQGYKSKKKYPEKYL